MKQGRIKNILLIFSLWFTSFCGFALMFYATIPNTNEQTESILGAIIAFYLSKFPLIGLANKNCSHRYFGIAIPLQKNQIIPIGVSFLWAFSSVVVQSNM